MMTPWFSLETARWLAFLSLFSLFSLLSYFIKQGRHRRVVTWVLALCATTGVVLLALAIIANMAGQPGHVVFPLGVAGVVMSTVFLQLSGNFIRCLTSCSM